MEWGRFVSAGLHDSNLVVRRVESITPISSGLLTRHISFDLSSERLSNLFRDYVPNKRLRELFIPIVALPKSIFPAVDAQYNGVDCSLAGRTLGTGMARMALAWEGSLLNGELKPPAPIWRFLHDVTHQFPEDQSYKSKVKRVPLISGIAEIDASEALTELNSGGYLVGLAAADLQWWINAWASQEWRNGLAKYQSSFIIAYKLNADNSQHLLKLATTERFDLLERRGKASMPAALWFDTVQMTTTISDIGRASSEHYRVVAPDGMFISAEGLGGASAWCDASVLERLVLYQPKATNPTSTISISALFAPSTRDFVAPARIITFFSTIVLLAGCISEWYASGLKNLPVNASALATAAVFIPTVTLAILLRSDEHPLKWIVLRKWRYTALLSLLPLAAAVTALLPLHPTGEDVWLPGVLCWIWSICLAISLYFSIAINRATTSLLWTETTRRKQLLRLPRVVYMPASEPASDAPNRAS
jgi:hypothetical protein